MYLWRAVIREGKALDMLVPRGRDSRAAPRLMRKLLNKQSVVPKQLATDRLPPSRGGPGFRVDLPA